ncbi:DUF397 domain-containing protein [Streptomyces triticagri]|uniref:DUF397 domain-containing protein n=1 Tax=Streptomyces triticagri TaxID=2293568 RepID=A0A372M444_9ACTN|nr:DUF397 domain-containing protein [Streptomyces triticagri]RFU85651.1 DUF397 domain-containing protein [Streptomyces triticagri]
MTKPPRHVLSSTVLNSATHGARWQRSSRSTGMNNCIETAGLERGPLSGMLAVRDSKHIEGPALLFSPTTWDTFLGAVRGEAFRTYD